MQSHKCRVEVKDHLPGPAGYTFVKVVVLIPDLVFCRATSWTVGLQAVLVHGVVLSQMQDFVFALFELHETLVTPFLQTVCVPLNNSPGLQHINSQFQATHKLADSALLFYLSGH